MTFRLSIVLFFCMAAGSAVADMACPKSPNLNVSTDIKSDINARVGSLGTVKAADIAVKTDVVSKNLFERYPNVDKLTAIQFMTATYCNLLKESSAISQGEKLDRWEKFQTKVFALMEK